MHGTNTSDIYLSGHVFIRHNDALNTPAVHLQGEGLGRGGDGGGGGGEAAN